MQLQRELDQGWLQGLSTSRTGLPGLGTAALEQQIYDIMYKEHIILSIDSDMKTQRHPAYFKGRFHV